MGPAPGIRKKQRLYTHGEASVRCPKCDCTFPKRHNLRKHLANMHKLGKEEIADLVPWKQRIGESGNVQCPECPCKVRDRSKLRVHLARRHNLDKEEIYALLPKLSPGKPADGTVKCPLCPTKLRHAHTMRAHLAGVHKLGEEEIGTLVPRRSTVPTTERECEVPQMRHDFCFSKQCAAPPESTAWCI